MTGWIRLEPVACLPPWLTPAWRVAGAAVVPGEWSPVPPGAARLEIEWEGAFRGRDVHAHLQAEVRVAAGERVSVNLAPGGWLRLLQSIPQH